MLNDTTLGIIAAAVPLLIIGFLALRRMPWILAFFVALVAVGLGYLDTTGTLREFGHKVRVTVPAGILPEHKKAAEETTAPATPPAEAPAMAPAPTPPAEPPAMAPASPPAAPAPAPAPAP